eukprot:TRINITY_DN5482_c0_g1_i2.p1 TRINITY_DN5482_c0_g1~~TRINITY_DN5482_c0_g1_i2.p1  ORF type:complete len:104 (-),score=11.06 TRINITY_DN5482_c0_g1_i2:58-369(-)
MLSDMIDFKDQFWNMGTEIIPGLAFIDIFLWHDSSRRHLGDQLFQDVALAPALVVQSPSYVLAPFSIIQSPTPTHSFYPSDPHETHSSSSSDFPPLISLEKHY